MAPIKRKQIWYLRWKEADHNGFDAIHASDEILVRPIGESEKMDVVDCSTDDQKRAAAVDHWIDEKDVLLGHQVSPSIEKKFTEGTYV